MSAVNESLKNTSEFAKRFPSKSEGIALCSVFMLSSVLIIAGSLLALVLFAVNKTLRRKSLFLVMNMAFADLMLGTFSVPFYIYFVGDAYQLWTAKFGFQENLFTNQKLLLLVIISFILMTLRCDSGVILWGEITSYLLWGVKWLNVSEI